MPDDPKIAMSKPTLAQQLAEAERELNLRLRVFPRWIEAGRIKPQMADKRMARQAAAVETLRGLVEAERQPGLVDG